MRKTLCLLALMSANAIAAPTFYGKMNFEMRYIDQDAEGRRAEVIGAATKNLPPRLGMIGFFKSEDLDTTIMYFGEMGYHTWGSDSDFGGGEMKLRLAGVSFENTFGKAIIGRHYPAGDLVGTEIDPLVDTGVSGQGLDQYYDVAGAKSFNGVGYYSRYFQDAFTYKTPVMKGFQLAATVDNNSRQDTKAIKYTYDSGSSVTTLAEEYSGTYYSLLATYNLELFGTKTKFFLGGVKGAGLSFNAAHLINTQSEERAYAAFNTTYKDLQFGAYYATSEYEKYNSEDVYNTTNMMVAGSYKFDRNSVGATYSRAEFKAPTDTTTQSQIALGYKRFLAKSVALTVNAARMDIDHDSATTTDNIAYIGTVGTALNF